MITAKLECGNYSKNVWISFIGDYRIVSVLDKLFFTIENKNNSIYEDAILTYINWKKENAKKQDIIKKGIQDFEEEIKDFKKKNKLQIFFHKNSYDQLQQKNYQLQQKEDQLQDLVDKANEIELRRKKLESYANSLIGVKLEFEFEKMLNDLEFHCISGYSKGLGEAHRYEFCGDEKKLVEKAQTILNILEKDIKSKSKLLNFRAINYCNFIDKKEGVNSKESIEKEIDF